MRTLLISTALIILIPSLLAGSGDWRVTAQIYGDTLCQQAEVSLLLRDANGKSVAQHELAIDKDNFAQSTWTPSVSEGDRYTVVAEITDCAGVVRLTPAIEITVQPWEIRRGIYFVGVSERMSFEPAYLGASTRRAGTNLLVATGEKRPTVTNVSERTVRMCAGRSDIEGEFQVDGEWGSAPRYESYDWPDDPRLLDPGESFSPRLGSVKAYRPPGDNQAPEIEGRRLVIRIEPEIPCGTSLARTPEFEPVGFHCCETVLVDWPQKQSDLGDMNPN